FFPVVNRPKTGPNSRSILDARGLCSAEFLSTLHARSTSVAFFRISSGHPEVKGRPWIKYDHCQTADTERVPEPQPLTCREPIAEGSDDLRASTEPHQLEK